MASKVDVGIPGFDHISLGGLPTNQTTLVAGIAGSGKTIFIAQFLATGIQAGGAGVFVTFEEPPANLRENLMNFGWNISAWEKENRWRFVDVSTSVRDEEEIIAGNFDFDVLYTRIKHAVDQTQADRVGIDSLSALLYAFRDDRMIRNRLRRLILKLKGLGLTLIITAERDGESVSNSTFGFEEFVTDNVVLLRNTLENEKRRRTIEIFKYRSSQHYNGKYPFVIEDGRGMMVIPLVGTHQHKSSSERVTSGNTQLDDILNGGLYRDSITLASGASGTGKTLLCTEFVSGGVAKNDRCVIFSFEESLPQLLRNANGWGYDYQQMIDNDLLQIHSAFPETKSIEDHYTHIQRTVEAFEPKRVVIDSLSALARIASEDGFREFVIAVSSYLKMKGITGLMTATTSRLMGLSTITESNISTLTDVIILLRYIEIDNAVGRGILVLKMRGSEHAKKLYRFHINDQGMTISAPFDNVTDVLS